MFKDFTTAPGGAVVRSSPQIIGPPSTRRGHEALARLLAIDEVKTILDIGSGDGYHAAAMRAAGRSVTTISLIEPADYVGDFMSWPSMEIGFDALWACHVLEHQVDPGAFLRECRGRLRKGGWLAVTVPPGKHEIVGGHVTVWNAGLLLYQLVLAGFDCSNARVGTYGYNISVIVQNVGQTTDLSDSLTFDTGDIDLLAPYFPCPVTEKFDGRLPNIRWDGAETQKPIDHVVIVGLGPSAEAYMDHVKRLGSRHAFADQVWAVNGLGSVLDCDLVWHMDDVRIQEIRAAARPESNIAAMLAWLKTAKVPVMTSFAHPDYPTLIEFPLEEVVNRLGRGYFNNTVPYALAYAICLGVKKISMFGCDYTYPNAHRAEKGRACLEFWLGYATREGIEIALPEKTSLMDAIDDGDPNDLPSYGYDAVKISSTATADGRFSLTMTPRERLPTAAEIEAAYDHGRPPAEQHRAKESVK